jgi:Ca2+-binding RTX toxin-like protein
VSSSGVALAAY